MGSTTNSSTVSASPCAEHRNTHDTIMVICHGFMGAGEPSIVQGNCICLEPALKPTHFHPTGHHFPPVHPHSQCRTGTCTFAPFRRGPSFLYSSSFLFPPLICTCAQTSNIFLAGRAYSNSLISTIIEVFIPSNIGRSTLQQCSQNFLWLCW